MVGNVQLMQRMNRIKVLNYIRKNGIVERPEIAKSTDLSPASITNIVTFLQAQDLVHPVGRASASGAGRRADLLSFNASAMHLICINIEPDEAHVALCDLGGTISSMSRISIAENATPDAVLGKLRDAAKALISECETVCAIGISISGVVKGGVVSSSTMRWSEVDVRGFFRREFKKHVYVVNNSKTKALWQVRQYHGEPYENIVFLDLTFGVGITSIYRGEINESVTGELGHTTVMKDGPLCFCGNRGCLELVCSQSFILDRCREAKLSVSTFEDVLTLFSKGDKKVSSILRECAEYLGIGIANIINLFEPSLIILNDNQLTSCEYIYQTALSEAEARAYHMFSKPVRYEKVSITTNQALRGISFYVCDRLFSLDGPDDILA